MNNNHTYELLKEMRFHGMAEALSRMLDNPEVMPETPMECVAVLVDAEKYSREERGQALRKKKAKLRHSNACLEDFDFSRERGVSRQMITWLSQLSWLDKNQNLIITGGTGSGKTDLACALANQAIRSGFSALYTRLPRLLEDLEISHGDGSLPSIRKKLQKPSILILDDWAVSPITTRGRLDLLEIIEDRSSKGSLIITSQMPVSKWHEYLGDPTIADAILDRVVHRSHKIEFTSASMRKIIESVGETNYV